MGLLIRQSFIIIVMYSISIRVAHGLTGAQAPPPHGRPRPCDPARRCAIVEGPHPPIPFLFTVEPIYCGHDILHPVLAVTGPIY